jgi:hypothetical protein
MRAKLKALFFIFRLHYFIPSNLYFFIGNLAGLSRFVHKHKKDGMCDYYSAKFDYHKREKLYEYVIDKFKLNDESINYLEFGVSKGVSFRWWVNKIVNKDSRFYGFDTFTGLPEDWGIFKAGAMSSGNKQPDIDDSRVKFYQGLFQQTLIPFLSDYKSEHRKVIHLDADLYSSTLFILTTMYPFLKPGDILFFDEFSVPMHEYKAFMEWTKSFYIQYEVLGSVNNFFRLAVIIK